MVGCKGKQPLLYTFVQVWASDQSLFIFYIFGKSRFPPKYVLTLNLQQEARKE